MAESIKTFENSLRDYLIGVGSDSYDNNEKRNYKYNNLKVYMDVDNLDKPHFFVSANISSILCTLDPLEIIEGSMGDDDAYILRWASRPNIMGELRKHYAYLSYSQSPASKRDVVDGFVIHEKNPTKEDLKEEIQQADDIITGSGLKNNRGKEDNAK